MPSAALDPERVRTVLLRVVAVLVVLAIAAQLTREWAPGSVTAHGLSLLDVTREQSVPTFFSALVLLASAALAAIVASGSTRYRTRWRVLALVVTALAVDEAVALHEASIVPLRRLLDAGGFLYYTWVVPAALIVVALVPVFRPLLAELDRRQRRLFMAAAATFFGGAIGLELIEGALADEHGVGDARLIPFVTLEEALELYGAVVFLYVLMDRLAPWRGSLALTPR